MAWISTSTAQAVAGEVQAVGGVAKVATVIAFAS